MSSTDAPLALPYAFAKRHGVLPLAVQDGRLCVACRQQPGSALSLELLRLYDGPLQFEALGEEAFNALLARYYDAGDSASARIVEHLDGDHELAIATAALPEPEDLLESADEAPIIRLINALFTEAIRENASDIHLECFENQLRVRFRIDGVLREVIRPPTALGPLLVSRVKVMASLDIAEKRVPQDGRISLRIGGRAIDVRVSTLPSAHGERAVLRLLDKSESKFTLEGLGMDGQVLSAFKRLVQQPHGIVLVTGPTGSGKTTSLYASLQTVDTSTTNVLTVEDPIEYELPGIGQTQVNSKIDLTFAKALRAILRQDPDVIMIGEIRDYETAQIAIQASLTGHLVLATLHTNDAPSAVTRLTDMGVEPFLLSSSLLGVLAQRLVRRLCPVCKRQDGEGRWHPVGCEACGHTGYKGRTGVYELMVADDAVRGLIHNRAAESELLAAAQAAGLRSMREDGERLIHAGVTSLEEVLRVTRE